MREVKPEKEEERSRDRKEEAEMKSQFRLPTEFALPSIYSCCRESIDRSMASHFLSGWSSLGHALRPRQADWEEAGPHSHQASKPA